jgi:hypothetical protein
MFKAAGEAAAKNAAEAAAKKGAKAAAEGAAKAAAEAAAKKGAKAAGEAAAKAAAEAAAKKGSKAAGEAAAKAAAKKGSKAAAEGAAKNAAKKSSKLVKAGKYAAGAAVVAGGVYYAADPYLENKKKNGAKLNIMSITTGDNPDTAIITYAEPIDIYKDDKVTISGANSATVVMGDYLLDKVISPTKLAIKLKDGEFISKNGTSGLMILHTSVANQRKLLNAEIAEGAGNVFNKAKDLISKIPGFKYIMYFFYFIIGIIALRIIFMVYGLFRSFSFGKKNKFNFGKFFKKRG